MKTETISRLHGEFERLVQTDAENGAEFWLARELQPLLGYAQWRSFESVVEKAMKACENAGQAVEDHFARARRMVPLGSGAEREIDDIALTRYACYLIAQNGDPNKEPIAFAQTYFAVQTRKQELIERRLAEVERLNARQKLSLSEKELSGIIYERLGDERSFARIRSKGDAALFGGLTTRLISVAPPFKSNSNYEVFRGETNLKWAVEDRHVSTQAYIDYIRPRCVEPSRLLKETGSFCYICDWHAGHFVKVTLDQIPVLALDPRTHSPLRCGSSSGRAWSAR